MELPRVAVVGAGWVGLITAVTLVRDGFSVVLVERSVQRVQALRSNVLPFFEPGLPAAWTTAVASGRLTVVQNDEYTCTAALAVVQLAIICVYTPSLPTGEVDCTGVEQATAWLAERLPPNAVIAIKSTVPPGTSERAARLLRAEQTIAANPEFLAESTALEDAYRPARVVLGCDDDRARPTLQTYAAPSATRGAHIEFMSTRSAEMVKYASNTFLLVKVSYANELATIAEALGADPSTVLRVVGQDLRIGSKFLRHGLGWGGGCFPKDTRGLQAAAQAVGARTSMLDAATTVNYARIPYYMDRLRQLLNGSIANQPIALLGLAFKPNTDDVRNSPAVRMLHALVAEGARVTAFDPRVGQSLQAQFPDVIFTTTLQQAVEGTRAAVIATDWQEIKDWKMSDHGYPGVVLDCRP